MDSLGFATSERAPMTELGCLASPRAVVPRASGAIDVRDPSPSHGRCLGPGSTRAVSSRRKREEGVSTVRALGLSRRRALFVSAAAVASLSAGYALNANAAPVVKRRANVTTENCAVAGGLCQANNPGQPGGNNPDVINAKMKIVDNGTTVSAEGTGSGFIPGRVYVSLLYLNPNAATCSRFPQGQAAQTANIANADNDFVSMFLGYWLVDGNGRGEFVTQPGKLSPAGNATAGSGLAAYGTVSVREAAGGFIAGNGQQIANNITGNAANGGDAAKGQDIPPNMFSLKACGSLAGGGGGR